MVGPLPLLLAALTAALVWALAVLLILPPKVHEGAPTVKPAEIRHIVIVLDVSPSMKLTDAGPTLKETRSQRAAGLLESFFQRVPMEKVRISVIATYTGAKPVVIDTKDVAVVRNILNDLPLSHAFKSGPTNIFDGITEAARIGQPWRRHSASLVMVTDGDSLPPTGMPQLPVSYRDTVVIGVGDSRSSKFIDGHQSRQEASTLRELATRLHGNYHDGNQHHLPTVLLNELVAGEGESPFDKLTLREYALALAALGALFLALLDPLLRTFGRSEMPSAANSGRGNTRAA